MTTETSSDDRELPPGYLIEPSTGAWLTLPWPSDPLSVPSLAPQILRWAAGKDGFGEARIVHHLTGDPWEFTRGQLRFLHLWYAVRPDGRWLWRSGMSRLSCPSVPTGRKPSVRPTRRRRSRCSSHRSRAA